MAHDVGVNPNHVLMGPCEDIEVGLQEASELFLQLVAQIFTQLQHPCGLMLAYCDLN